LIGKVLIGQAGVKPKEIVGPIPGGVIKNLVPLTVELRRAIEGFMIGKKIVAVMIAQRPVDGIFRIEVSHKGKGGSFQRALPVIDFLVITCCRSFIVV
jgi:hypothetical protein